MATPANPPAARGRGRGGRSGVPARSHQSRSRHAGLGAGQRQIREELSVLDRTAHKFCHVLYGCVRQEPVFGVHTDEVGMNKVDWLVGDLEWLVVTMHDDQLVDANEAWRRMREKLEALSVLSVLACTESYAWRRNEAFWRQFMEREQGRSPASSDPRRPQRHANLSSVPAPRADTTHPRFLLDFSFAEITADVVTLLRHVLLGSEKSMRLSFKHAMESLATIRPRGPRAANIPVALRFARCQLRGNDTTRKIIELVKVVNRARHDRLRELGTTTSKAFYYDIVELDLSSVRLGATDLKELRLLDALPQTGCFRLVLDGAISGSTDCIIPFGSLVSSWFNPNVSTEPESEPHPDTPSSTQAVRSSGVSTVSLNSSALSSHHVASLFSAIRAGGGSSVSRLSLRGALQLCDPLVAWAWVALGVLCSDSLSNLESLDLSRNVIRPEDAAVVTQINKTSNQLTKTQVICQITQHTSVPTASQPPKKNRSRRRSAKRRQELEDPTPTKNESSPHSWIRLDEGTRLTPLTPGGTASLNLTSSIFTQVVATHHNGDTVVLVPGYGFLAASSSIGTQAQDVAEVTSAENRLQELKLNSMVIPGDAVHPDTVFETLFSSLSLHSLVNLELNGTPLAQGSLRAIIAACPTLQSLSVEDCELQSIAAITDAYSRGACRIQSLNLTENHIGDRDIVDLSRLIARAASPASCLRALNLHLNPLTHRALRALGVAIRESPRALVHVVLDKDHDPDAQVRAVFYPLQDQYLGVEPLSDAHQRAFQDALARRLRTTALEPSLIARIHAYAAHERRRRILWR